MRNRPAFHRTILSAASREAGSSIVLPAAGGVAGAFVAKTFFLGRGSLVDDGASGIDDLSNAPRGVAGVAIGGLIFGPAAGASFNPARWPLPTQSPRRGESAEPPVAD
jgi:hypothetical protein